MPSRLAKLDLILEQAIKQLIGLHNILPETTDNHLLDLGKRYELTIVTDVAKVGGAITFDHVDGRQKRMLADLLSEEFGVYHTAVIKDSHIKRLIFCNNLKNEGQSLSGLAEVGRFVLDTLIINATACDTDWERVRGTLHHEIFHAIDYRDDIDHYLDPEWRKLNGEDFKYNDALQFAAGLIYSDSVYIPHFDFRGIDEAPPGFLNTYATQSVHEDKAVFYSWLLVKHSDLLAIAERDEVVKAKVRRMKELLEKFHPSFNNYFWKKMDKSSRFLSTDCYIEWKERLARARTGGSIQTDSN